MLECRITDASSAVHDKTVRILASQTAREALLEQLGIDVAPGALEAAGIR